MFFLDPISVIFLLWLGWLLDRLLAEPRRWHPLVGFGHLARRLEGWLNRYPEQPLPALSAGILAWLMLLIPMLGLYLWLHLGLPQAWVLDVLLLYLALGGQSLQQHIGPIQQALAADELPLARQGLAAIVSRDTDELDTGQVCTAAVESTLENSNDAIYGPLFWFAVAGGGGALVYRLTNTLDAMWGYRTQRHEWFGKFAARMDDLLNLFPATLTAILFNLQTRHWSAIRTAWVQGLHWKSPNAGLVMASGAASLGCRLGGAARYYGELHERPTLGLGGPATLAKLGRARRRIKQTTWLWLMMLSGVLYGLA